MIISSYITCQAFSKGTIMQFEHTDISYGNSHVVACLSYLFYDLFPHNVLISCFVVIAVAVAGFLLSLWFFISNIDGTDVYLMLRYRGDVIFKGLPVDKISESNKYL